MNINKLVRQTLASGKTPKWCSHIKFWCRAAGEEDTFVGRESFPEAGGWSFKTLETSCGISADKWKFCPICGAPHPN